MRKILLTIVLLTSILLTSFAQLTTFYVVPHTIDASYAVGQDSNLVVLNSSITSNNKLLVFLPGTGALTKHYKLFPQLAANIGYHCVSIAYPNGTPTVASICAGNVDTNCYYNIRKEVCYGTDASTNVSVDTLNSINTRLIKLLQYLTTTYPAAGWGQFLSGTTPVWNKIAIAGHSQGGGHALYLAKTQTCDRMIMFAGADDYSDYYSKPANWVHFSSSTPVSKFFSFLQLHDDVWDYSKQYAVVQGTGMTAAGDDSTIVDNTTPPYSNSHCLYTAIPPLYPGVYSANHDGMVVDFYTPLSGSIPVYQPVWNYVLTEALTTDANEITAKGINIRVFPNPATDALSIVIDANQKTHTVKIINLMGEVLVQKSFSTNELSLELTDLSSGIYFIQIDNCQTKFIKN